MFAPSSDQAALFQRWGTATHGGVPPAAPSCPRCASGHTKFCYYNNYSLSQPRYFCKSCRRYWTKGGSLRNVPVGGGCRKNRRNMKNSSRSQAPASGQPDSADKDSGVESPQSASPVTTADAGDIDMAAVFAKFLNNEQTKSSSQDLTGSAAVFAKFLNNEQTKSSSRELTGSAAVFAKFLNNEQTKSSSRELTGSISSAVTPDGVETAASLVLVEEQVELPLEVPLVEGLFMETNGLDRHESADDLLWGEKSCLANFAWQPMVQLQEIGTSPSDDQFRLLSADDNFWSSFDLSGFELSSRP